MSWFAGFCVCGQTFYAAAIPEERKKKEMQAMQSADCEGCL